MSRENVVNDEAFSWNRLRTDEELGDFVSRKLAKFAISEAEIALEV